MNKRNLARDEAKARGDLFYFTGIPCPKGHIANRYVSAMKCLACANEEMAQKRVATQIRKASAKLSPRQQAQKEGRSRYNTGKPCPKDHMSDRDTANGSCLECNRLGRIRREAENAELRDSRLVYHKENAERYRVHARNRRAKFKNVPGSHTQNDIDELWDKQVGRCRYCKKRLDHGFHVDHIKAVAKGGDNSKNNIQLTCKRCNLRKHTKTHAEFLKTISVT